MIYVYDDVAPSQSLMISPETWQRLIRPRHQQIIDLGKRFGARFMYHTDGAVGPLILPLIFSAFSMNSAWRRSTTSRTPPISPALTMFT